MNFSAISQAILAREISDEAKLFLLGVFFAFFVRVFRTVIRWVKRASTTYFD